MYQFSPVKPDGKMVQALAPNLGMGIIIACNYIFIILHIYHYRNSCGGV